MPLPFDEECDRLTEEGQSSSYGTPKEPLHESSLCVKVCIGLTVFGMLGIALAGIMHVKSTTSVSVPTEGYPTYRCVDMPDVNISHYKDGDSFQKAVFYSRPTEPSVVSNPEICEKPDKSRQWKNCVPYYQKWGVPECTLATRDELLRPAGTEAVCVSSILDMMGTAVFDAMGKAGCRPMLTHGTALGAFRNSTIVPWTQDFDVSYLVEGNKIQCDFDMLHDILYQQGYSLFHDNIYRVCPNMMHPLAPNFVETSRPEPCNQYECSWVDLYSLSNKGDGTYFHSNHQDSWDGLISKEDIFPYGTVDINGRKFNTVGNLTKFLSRVYGPNYMSPPDS